MKLAHDFINIEMGKEAREHALEAGPIALTKDEKNAAVKRFNELDTDRKGYVTINDLRRYFKVEIDLFHFFLFFFQFFGSSKKKLFTEYAKLSFGN